MWGTEQIRRAWSQAKKSYGLNGKQGAKEEVEARGEVKQVTIFQAKGWGSVVKHTPSICESLGLIHSTSKDKR